MRMRSAFIGVEDCGAIGGIGVFPSIESYVRLTACHVMGYTRDKILLGLKRLAEEAYDDSGIVNRSEMIDESTIIRDYPARIARNAAMAWSTSSSLTSLCVTMRIPPVRDKARIPLSFILCRNSGMVSLGCLKSKMMMLV